MAIKSGCNANSGIKRISGGGGSRKKYWGAGPSSFGRQQRLSEITIEPIKNLGAWARFGGLCPAGPNLESPLDSRKINCPLSSKMSLDKSQK